MYTICIEYTCAAYPARHDSKMASAYNLKMPTPQNATQRKTKISKQKYQTESILYIKRLPIFVRPSQRNLASTNTNFVFNFK